MVAMRTVLLAGLALALAAAAPARGEDPAPPAPAAPAPAPDDEAGEPAEPGAASAQDDAGAEDGPRRRSPVVPGDGELPPPRAIAEPPSRARAASPAELTRRTSLGVNLLGAGTGLVTDAAGTWRVEAVLERAVKPHVGAAGILAVGQVRKDGRDDAWTVELAGQGRWYFAGRFDRGAYLAGTLGFWSVDPYLAWSLGGGVGLKRTFAGGLTLDLLAGFQLPVEWFRHDDGGNPPTLWQAWRALLPGPMVTLGGSFDEGHGGSSSRRAR
jgi:hypothetical protein